MDASISLTAVTKPYRRSEHRSAMDPTECIITYFGPRNPGRMGPLLRLNSGSENEQRDDAYGSVVSFKIGTPTVPRQ